MIKSFLMGAASMSGLLFGLAIAYPVETPKAAPLMAGPPSCIEQHVIAPQPSDAPSIEDILAALPLPVRQQVTYSPPLPKPRPQVDQIAALIGGL